MLFDYDPTKSPSYELGSEAAMRKFNNPDMDYIIWEAKWNIARNLFEDKRLSIEDIAKLTELPIEEVKRLDCKWPPL